MKSLYRILWLVALVLMQLLIFNHIHPWGILSPLPFVFILLLIPYGYPRWGVMIWGFLCGMLCDATTLTPGVGAASMTLVAFLQPLLIKSLNTNEDKKNFLPTPATFGKWAYFAYVALLSGIFTLAYFLLQYVIFFSFIDWLLVWLSSWLVTLVLCLLLQRII